MSFVDLHCHTTYSDGYDKPSSVVLQAKENGVSVMAVTDHDNLGGLDEAVKAGKENGVAVVTGVEISSRFHDRTIHILGLGIDKNNSEIISFLEKVFAARRESIIARMSKLNEDFSAAKQNTFSMEEFIASQGRYFDLNKAANYLVIGGFVTEHEAARKMISGTRVSVGFKAAAEEVIAAIHGAGGLAISAHPLAGSSSLKKIDPSPEAQEKMLAELASFGLDGMECYQSSYEPEDTAFGLQVAKKLGLLVSAGSDWHGAVCDEGISMKDIKLHYPDNVGGLKTTTDMIAPLLGRLGGFLDKK